MLEVIRNQLIVSCQPVPGGPLDKAEIVAAFALAAIAGGAKGLRIEGALNIAAVRAVTDAPIIGLIKRDLSHSEVRITPYLEDIDDIVSAGADIVAFDATTRTRPISVGMLIGRIKKSGKLAMADCSCVLDAQLASAAGADIIGTTLSGYTSETPPLEPDIALVHELASWVDFLIAEGRYHTPSQASDAIAAGADAVVVGSAITRTEHITSWFANKINPQHQQEEGAV